MRTTYRNAFLMLALGLTLPFSYAFSQSVGAKAPDFSLQTLDGTNFSLSDKKGKVVFVFMFGNTCSHCITNGPNTQSSIYKIFKDNPDFVAVGIDVWDGNTASVQNFKEITGVEYPLCLNGSAVPGKYNSTYDRMLVIDREGILRYKSTADATAGVVAKAAEMITSLLGGATGIGDPGKLVSGLKAYPNPASDELSVQTSFSSGTSVFTCVMDLSGRLVHDKIIPVDGSGILKIEVGALPIGIYYLKAADQSTVLSTRIAIMR